MGEAWRTGKPLPRGWPIVVRDGRLHELEVNLLPECGPRAAVRCELGGELLQTHCVRKFLFPPFVKRLPKFLRRFRKISGKRKRYELARQTMTQLDKLPSIEKARQLVASIQAKWQAKVDSVLLRPTADDAATATLFWEVREKFANLKDQQDRMKWIQKFGNDPLIPSALLHGPAGLTNLSEAETALLQLKAEALADPKITDAKGKVTRAMASACDQSRSATQLERKASDMPRTRTRRGLGMHDLKLALFLLVAVSQLGPNLSAVAEDLGNLPPAQAAPLGTVPVVGSLVFWQTSQIATPVMGRIASLPVRVGDRVKQGDIVAQINTDQLNANLSVAQSGVLNARSQLAVAEAQLVLETTTRDRLAKLKSSPSFREATWEDANNRVSVASAAVEAAKSLIIASETEVARQEVNVNLATVKAPFDGVVVRHLLTVGALVSDYNSSILVMVDDSAPEIELEVPIEYLSSITLGNELTYTLNSGRRQQAKVRAVLPSTTPNAKTRIVRLDPGTLEAGQNFSEVNVVTVYLPKS